MLLNFDLRQIEVVCFAQLCKDPKLIQFLNEGKDLHRYMASIVNNKLEKDITDQERSAAKAIDFGLIYGNGPLQASKTTGKSTEWCRDFIKTFYKEFKYAKLWHEEICEQVERTGELQIWTGETIKFTKYPAKYDWQIKKGIKESYNPPDIKNHPVQHSAFIIMAMLLGDFYREKAIHKKEKYLLINTVHDSLMLDCKPEYIEEATDDVNETTCMLPEKIYNTFGIKILVPINIESTSGNSWYDL
jgi:DNA polymerase-1